MKTQQTRSATHRELSEGSYAEKVFQALDNHTTFLCEGTNKAIELGIKFLILLNGGGAVAILGYLGAKGSKPDESGRLLLALVLICFLVGLILTGLAIWKEYRTWASTIKTWQEKKEKFSAGEISLDELISVGTADQRISEILAGVSFLLFIVGIILGAILFFGLMTTRVVIFPPGGSQLLSGSWIDIALKLLVPLGSLIAVIISGGYALIQSRINRDLQTELSKRQAVGHLQNELYREKVGAYKNLLAVLWEGIESGDESEDRARAISIFTSRAFSFAPFLNFELIFAGVEILKTRVKEERRRQGWNLIFNVRDDIGQTKLAKETRELWESLPAKNAGRPSSS